MSGYFDYINVVGSKYLETGQVLVIERENIIGFLKIEELPDSSLWLSGIRVDPEFRRQGIADKLTEAAENITAIKGLHSVRMLIHSDNKASLRLAAKHSFRLEEVYHFCRGFVGLDEMAQADPEYNALVNVGWRFMRYTGGVENMGKFFSNGDSCIFVYNDGHTHFFQPMKGVIAFREAKDSIACISQGQWGHYSELMPLEDFGEGSVFCKEV